MYTSPATGGRMVGRPARAATASSSGAPSITTASGASSSSAAATARALPGPWWRMPRTATPVTDRSGQLAAGPVQVGPAGALLDHRLQVLLPDDAVLDRVLHDG